VAKTTALKANFWWTSGAIQYPVLLPKVNTTACLNPCTRGLNTMKLHKQCPKLQKNNKKEESLIEKDNELNF